MRGREGDAERPAATSRVPLLIAHRCCRLFRCLTGSPGLSVGSLCSRDYVPENLAQSRDLPRRRIWWQVRVSPWAVPGPIQLAALRQALTPIREGRESKGRARDQSPCVKICKSATKRGPAQVEHSARLGPGKRQRWALLGRQHCQDNQGNLGQAEEIPQSRTHVCLVLVMQKTAVEQKYKDSEIHPPLFIWLFRGASFSIKLVSILQWFHPASCLEFTAMDKA